MPKTRPPYPLEFRRQMVELVRTGRTPEELSREFEPTAQSIRNWVEQTDLDEGRRQDGPTTAEREELRRLRRENRQLREEREILKNSRARFGTTCRTRNSRWATVGRPREATVSLLVLSMSPRKNVVRGRLRTW